jgi:threonine/homoserine/homoserine lactone efflux protein
MSPGAFAAFAGLSLMAAVSPGPAVLMAARTGVTEGFRTGAMLAAGIGLGGVFWAGAAMSGLGLIFTWAPGLLVALRVLGAAYLIFLAVRLWRGAVDPMIEGESPALPRSPASALWRGIATQLSNPKPVILFSAIFLGTLPADTAGWVKLALLAVVFANETLWNILVARIFSLDRARATYISLKTIIDRSFAGLLAALGVKIAVL